MEERCKINMMQGDCMDWMKDKPNNYYDLAIVDPPYGENDAINIIDNKNLSKQATKRTKYNVFENKKPLDDYYIELIRVSKNQIVWGGNFLGLTGGVVAWNKNGTAFGEGEIAICSTHKSVSFFEYTWNGMLQGNMKNKETRIHPTQKPVALYKWLLQNYAKEGDKILDTHGGSGSICIACWDLKFDLDWIELDADYYKEAVERFKRHKNQLQMF